MTRIVFALLLFASCADDPARVSACEVAGWCGYACGEIAAWGTDEEKASFDAEACRDECIMDVATTGAKDPERYIDDVGRTCNWLAVDLERAACSAAIDECAYGL